MIADVHLGSWVCRAVPLVHALARVRNQYEIGDVFLPGDIFDAPRYAALSALSGREIAVVEALRNLGERRFWVPGNHDGAAAEEVLAILDAREGSGGSFHVWERRTRTGGTRRFFLSHGDEFDGLEHGASRRAVNGAERMYRAAQMVFPRLARRVKEMSPAYRRVRSAVARGVAEKAASHQASTAFYGHMHNGCDDGFRELGVRGVSTHNSGSAVETPSSFIILHYGRRGRMSIERRFF